MNARMYDPTTGKFMATDPQIQDAGNLQGLNAYAYVTNNPLSFTDPTGNRQSAAGGDDGGGYVTGNPLSVINPTGTYPAASSASASSAVASNTSEVCNRGGCYETATEPYMTRDDGAASTGSQAGVFSIIKLVGTTSIATSASNEHSGNSSIATSNSHSGTYSIARYYVTEPGGGGGSYVNFGEFYEVSLSEPTLGDFSASSGAEVQSGDIGDEQDASIQGMIIGAVMNTLGLIQGFQAGPQLPEPMEDAPCCQTDPGGGIENNLLNAPGDGSLDGGGLEWRYTD
jgi:hypothetical protein